MRVWFHIVWFHIKTRTLFLIGAALALAGLVLVLQLAVLLVWQYAVALDTRAWPRLALLLLFADHSQLAETPVAPFLQFVPEIQWSWLREPAHSPDLHKLATALLDAVHVGLLPALLGALMALAGVIVAIQQKNALAGAKRDKADRLRRVHEYRKQRQDPNMDRGITGDPTQLIESADKAWRRERAQGRRR